MARGGACAAMGGWGACVVGGVHGRGACVTCMPPGQILRLRHMVNERSVRILLECILVNLAFAIYWGRRQQLEFSGKLNIYLTVFF